MSLKLVEVVPFLEEDSPTSDFLKEALSVEDFLLVTDRPKAPLFKEVKDILNILDQNYNLIVLEETTNRKDIENVLSKFTRGHRLPHLFYKQKYVASGERIIDIYETGELEYTTGMLENLYIEPPSRKRRSEQPFVMYPGDDGLVDYKIKLTEDEKSSDDDMPEYEEDENDEDDKKDEDQMFRTVD